MRGKKVVDNYFNGANLKNYLYKLSSGFKYDNFFDFIKN